MEELHLSNKTSYEKESNDNKPLDVKVTKASIGKRVVAFLLDSLLIFTAFILLQTSVVDPIANAAIHTDQIQEEYVARLKESELYDYNSDGNIAELPTAYDSRYKDEGLDVYEYFNTHISDFYTNFASTNDAGEKLIDISEYYSQIKEATTLFTYTESGEGDSYVFTYAPVTDYDNTEMYNFMSDAYNVALTALGNDEMLLTYSKKIIISTVVEVVISLTIVNIIFMLVIPLCLRQRQTIGQLIMKIGVASRATGLVAKRSQIVVSFIVFFFLELALSVVTLLVPALVSFTLMVFTKEHNTVHNYLSATLVCDVSNKKLYRNEREALEDAALQQDKYGDSRFVNTYQELNLGSKDKEPRD